MRARSGQPFTLAVTGDVANIGNDVSWWNYARPNLVGDPTPSHRTAAEWYNPAAFAVPQFSFGNVGRNVLSSDHLFGADISLFKTIPMPSENLGRIELRFESFNTFNHTSFTTVSSNINSNTFGQLTAAHDPRNLQLALKLNF